jgi:hypothetical protein
MRVHHFRACGLDLRRRAYPGDLARFRTTGRSSGGSLGSSSTDSRVLRRVVHRRYLDRPDLRRFPVPCRLQSHMLRRAPHRRHLDRPALRRAPVPSRSRSCNTPPGHRLEFSAIRSPPLLSARPISRPGVTPTHPPIRVFADPVFSAAVSSQVFSPGVTRTPHPIRVFADPVFSAAVSSQVALSPRLSAGPFASSFRGSGSFRWLILPSYRPPGPFCWLILPSCRPSRWLCQFLIENFSVQVALRLAYTRDC